MNPLSRKVWRILEEVRRRGDAALLRFVRRYDRIPVSRKNLRLRPAELSALSRQVPADTKAAIRRCVSRVQAFHEAEARQARPYRFSLNGVSAAVEWRPLERVGIYVPGGRFAYPSTVWMTALPARAAGVRRIALATPRLTPEVAYACRLCGVSEVYRMGGPAAIAAFAYGTKTVPRVDLIAGPGGAYVSEAKRLLYGRVGLDLPAGPSELAVVWDGSVPLSWAISDLAAQKEHDPLAEATLIAVGRGARLSPQANRSLRKGKIRVRRVAAWEEAARLADRISPEHLEILCRRPAEKFFRSARAGVVFIGPYSTAVLGDYIAGPSHVLPTGAAARFASGLSVFQFLRRVPVVEVRRSSYRRLAMPAAEIASAEGMAGHRRSLEIRLS